MTPFGTLGIFIVANALLALFGAVITGLSYIAYRSSDGAASFRNSTIGFGLITLGGVTEPMYQLGIKRDYHISGLELLQLQAMEGILLAIGFAFLFLSIYGYVPGSRRKNATLDSRVVEVDERDV